MVELSGPEAMRPGPVSQRGLGQQEFERPPGRAFRAARGVESGSLSVNSHSSVRYHTPFGGCTQSGLGRELDPDAVDAFTETKNAFIATEEGHMGNIGNRLQDRAVVVTGGGSGIGLASARRLAAEDAKVVIGDLCPGPVNVHVPGRQRNLRRLCHTL